MRLQFIAIRLVPGGRRPREKTFTLPTKAAGKREENWFPESFLDVCTSSSHSSYLVGGLEYILFSHILGIIIPIDFLIIPIDELIFFRGVAQPPTSHSSYMFPQDVPVISYLFLCVPMGDLMPNLDRSEKHEIHWGFPSMGASQKCMV